MSKFEISKTAAVGASVISMGALATGAEAANAKQLAPQRDLVKSENTITNQPFVVNQLASAKAKHNIEQILLAQPDATNTDPSVIIDEFKLIFRVELEAINKRHRELQHKRAVEHEQYWFGPAFELGVLKQLGTATNAKLAFKIGEEKRFSHAQIGCADAIYYEESKFEVHAANGESDAYGIPQANPGYKMSASGQNWQDNASTQIKWGYSYMDGRYGSPCNALAYHNANGNY